MNFNEIDDRINAVFGLPPDTKNDQHHWRITALVKSTQKTIYSECVQNFDKAVLYLQCKHKFHGKIKSDLMEKHEAADGQTIYLIVKCGCQDDLLDFHFRITSTPLPTPASDLKKYFTPPLYRECFHSFNDAVRAVWLHNIDPNFIGKSKLAMKHTDIHGKTEFTIFNHHGSINACTCDLAKKLHFRIKSYNQETDMIGYEKCYKTIKRAIVGVNEYHSTPLTSLTMNNWEELEYRGHTSYLSFHNSVVHNILFMKCTCDTDLNAPIHWIASIGDQAKYQPDFLYVDFTQESVINRVTAKLDLSENSISILQKDNVLHLTTVTKGENVTVYIQIRECTCPYPHDHEHLFQRFARYF